MGKMFQHKLSWKRAIFQFILAAHCRFELKKVNCYLPGKATIHGAVY